MKTFDRKDKPRCLYETRRSYTSKQAVLTEEEFWSQNNRRDERRRGFPNILPAEVYQLSKTWKPEDVLTSVANILGAQLAGPQRKQREDKRLHLRDDPKLAVVFFLISVHLLKCLCARATPVVYRLSMRFRRGSLHATQLMSLLSLTLMASTSFDPYSRRMIFEDLTSPYLTPDRTPL